MFVSIPQSCFRFHVSQWKSSVCVRMVNLPSVSGTRSQGRRGREWSVVVVTLGKVGGWEKRGDRYGQHGNDECNNNLQVWNYLSVTLSSIFIFLYFQSSLHSILSFSFFFFTSYLFYSFLSYILRCLKSFPLWSFPFFLSFTPTFLCCSFPLPTISSPGPSPSHSHPPIHLYSTPSRIPKHHNSYSLDNILLTFIH